MTFVLCCSLTVTALPVGPWLHTSEAKANHSRAMKKSMLQLWQNTAYKLKQIERIKEGRKETYKKFPERAKRPHLHSGSGQHSVIPNKFKALHDLKLRTCVENLLKAGKPLIFVDLKGFKRPDVIYIDNGCVISVDIKLNGKDKVSFLQVEKVA